MIKLVAMLIFPLSQSGNDRRGRGRLRQRLFVLATLNTIQKYFKKDLNTKIL
jgi:hypothetical protein